MIGELKRYNSISRVESAAAHAAVHGEYLSGFLGGQMRGGRWVRELEDKWAETFGVKHAIACNSATSGLLAACAAFRSGDRLPRNSGVICSPYTMSATAAAPRFFGCQPIFVDIEAVTFGINPLLLDALWPYAVIVTNLFGHPARLHELVRYCRKRYIPLIEDNAQSPFAAIAGQYTGTFGDIGVFSLNVHKHIQCGEGGICVTNSDELAESMRQFINHGEMSDGPVGLNLRMTEVSAAIAFAQLSRAQGLVQQRIEIAEAIIAAIGDIPGLQSPLVYKDCRHVFYAIPFIIADRRTEFVAAVAAEGVPLNERYVSPLYRLKTFQAFARQCPVAEAMHDHHLFYYENCAWDPTPHQIKLMGEAFQKVAERMKL